MNGLTYAYIGDAYYELRIRKYLIDRKMTRVNALHKRAIDFTSSVAQAKIIVHMIETEVIDQEEIARFKNGRNTSGPGRKNVDARTYHMATGFEALIGALYLENQARADELVDIAIRFIEGEN